VLQHSNHGVAYEKGKSTGISWNFQTSGDPALNDDQKDEGNELQKTSIQC
jgi:hypothetical protein